MGTSKTIYEREDVWYPWKCVSLVKSNGASVDFTIDNEISMMLFLHVFHRKIYKPANGTNFLRDYKLQKIKMKLQFEADYKQLSICHMFQLAIFNTLLEKQRIAALYMKKSMKIDREAQNRIFYKKVDPITKRRRDPTFDERTLRLANLI